MKDVMEYTARSFELFQNEWALLTAGTKDHWNTMTIAWGGLGTLWGKPAATVYVRPDRYTFQFMDLSDIFTVSFLIKAIKRIWGILERIPARMRTRSQRHP